MGLKYTFQNSLSLTNKTHVMPYAKAGAAKKMLKKKTTPKKKKGSKKK